MLRRGIAQVQDAVNVHGAEAFGQARADAPHLAHFNALHPLEALRLGQGVKITYAVEYGVLFSQVVGKFCQGFSRSNADAHGQARPLFDALFHGVAHGDATTVQVRHCLYAHKGLVNAVHL